MARSGGNPFVRPEVIKSCYEHPWSDSEPLVLLAEVEGRAWVFPLRIDAASQTSRPVARLCGHGLLDLLDCIGPDDSVPVMVIQGLIDALRAGRPGVVLDLSGLEPTSSLLAGMRSWARLIAPAVFVASEHTVCLLATLRTGGGGMVGAKRTLRKRLAYAARTGFRLLIPTTHTDVKRSIDALLEWHACKWQCEAPSEELSAQAAMVRDWSMRPWARVPTLMSADGRPVAVLMTLSAGRREYFYMQSYDPGFAAMSPSRCAIALLLARLADEGSSGLDFLRGEEAYKREFCDHSYPLMRVTVACDLLSSSAEVSQIHQSFI